MVGRIRKWVRKLGYDISPFPGAATLISPGATDDIFVVKLSGTDGSVTWVKQFGASGIDAGSDVAIDSRD